RTGPPFPGNAERDRAGLRTAVAALRQSVAGRIFLGGHSYGGRQSTLLCAAEPELVQPDAVKSELVSGLLVLSYPLHPPRKPQQLRVQHLPNLRTTSLFVHGARPLRKRGRAGERPAARPAQNRVNESGSCGTRLGFQGEGASDRTSCKHPRQIRRDFRLGPHTRKQSNDFLGAPLRLGGESTYFTQPDFEPPFVLS